MFSYFLSKEYSNLKLNIKHNILIKNFHKRTKNIEQTSLPSSISPSSRSPLAVFPLIRVQYLKYLVQIYRSLLTQINFQLFRLHSIINEMHSRLTYRKLCKSFCRMQLATLSQSHVAYGECYVQLNLFRQADRSAICMCIYIYTYV